MKRIASYLLVASLLACCVIDANADDQRRRPSRRKMGQAPEPCEVLVFLKPGTDGSRCAREHGMQMRHRLRSNPNAYVLKASSPQAAKLAKQKFGKDSRVRAVYLNRRTYYEKQAFVPNDPYFHKDTPEPPPNWPGQWHLVNEHVLGLDANVQPAWDQDITGLGVTIGIIDDCFETAHPDLWENYVAADSYDFGDGDADPNPVYSDDDHGISVAGVAAARGNNGIGVTGVAPYAGLAGLRIDWHNQTDAMFADATLHNSATIKVKNHSYMYPVLYEPSLVEVDALGDSVELGTIHCFSAGNYRGTLNEDSNKFGLQNSPDAITVAALGSDEKYASYSNFGACVFVTAPSSSDGLFKITTTDRTGETYGYNGGGDAFPDPDYTSILGGTSAASPIVSGVMALGCQVQSALDTRFAKHLLVKSCDMVDPDDPDWKINAAGYHFNPNYGFGLINAAEFTRLAPLYSGVTTPLVTETVDNQSVGLAIPDGVDQIEKTFNIVNTNPLEEIRVTLSFTHPHSGHLEASLTSPSGTQSRLMKYASGDNTINLDWTYTTNAFWGENPSGTWTLSVRDAIVGNSGYWNSFSVTMRMGNLVPRSGPPGFAFHPVEQRVHFGDTATFTVEAVGSTPLTYQWQKDESDLSNGFGISGATTDILQIASVEGDRLGSYRCVVTNGQGDATSDSADLRIVYIVESREYGLNYDRYFETLGSTFYYSTDKSSAPLTTSGIGSRWASMDSAASENQARYSFTPSLQGRYEVYVTWPPSANATNSLEHIVTHAGGWGSVFLDQDSDTNPGGADTWNSIGQYNLMSGDPYYVTQSNVDYPGSGIFLADAVMWELVNLNGGPAVTLQPIPQNVCPVATAVFTVAATGEGVLTYQWQKNQSNLANGGHYSGCTTPTLTVTNASADSGDVGDYCCVVTDDRGSTASNEAALTITPNQFITQPVDLTPLEHATAIFSVEASGLGILAYQWQKDESDLMDGGKVSGATTDTLQITDVGDIDEGTYCCEVTSDCGTMISDYVLLTIYTGPPIEHIVESREGGLNYDHCTVTEPVDWTLTDSKSTAPDTTQGIGSLYSAVNMANRTVTYRYTPIVSGRYYLFVTWPLSTNGCISAKHVVTHIGGPTTDYLNQYNTGNQWYSLGEFPLLINEEYTVTQHSGGSQPVGRVIRADAVKWVLHENGILAPVISQQPSDDILGEGETATFTVAAYGVEPLSYQWQWSESGTIYSNIYDDDRISGATDATLQIAGLIQNDAGYYRCEVSNSYPPSEISDGAELTVTEAIVSCLNNADFEGGFYPLDDPVNPGVGTHWTKFDRIGNVTCDDDSAVFNTGLHSQRIYCQGSEDGGIYQQFDVTPGRTYTVSVYIKCQGGGMEGQLGVDPYGDTNPWGGSIEWGSKNYDYFSKKTWTGTVPMGNYTGKITVFLRAIQYRSWDAGYCWFDTVEPVCPELAVLSAESCKTHGASGDFCIDVLDRTLDADIECRQDGVTRLIARFDQDIQRVNGDLTDVMLSSGSVTSITLSASDELTIEMTDTTNGVPLTVWFPGIAAADYPSWICTDSVCVRQLIGDVRADSSINALDRVDVRDLMGQAVTGGNFRGDVRSEDGSINAIDRVDVRDAMGTAFTGSCP